VAEYIEKFDELVHQILAHDAKFNSANVVNKFIAGLIDDIRVVVLIHRPESLDTASSLALLQEELTADLSRKNHRVSNPTIDHLIILGM